MQFQGHTFSNVGIDNQPSLFLWKSAPYQRRAFRVSWSNEEIVQLLGRGGDIASVQVWLDGTATLAALKALADAGVIGTLSGVPTPEGVMSYDGVRLDSVADERWVPSTSEIVLVVTLNWWRPAQ